MQLFHQLEDAQEEVQRILSNPILTHEQTMMQLAKTAENILPYPQETPAQFYSFYEEGFICDVSEGHAPYAARYILPDYEKLFREGCKHLRLDPPTNLMEAIHTLLIFYRSVPSVTHFPVYLGEVDTLFEPFITGEPKDKEQIRMFLIHCDRTLGSSFCHMNLGSKATKAGALILKCQQELKNPVPNMTILYDPDETPDDYAELAIETALISANPAFAFKPSYKKDYNNKPFGIVSCYNGLPIGGGAFSLARIRLNKIALKSSSYDDFVNKKLPEVVQVFCKFMEAKIDYLVERTPFFTKNFLVTEGFIHFDDFVGLFGMVGMADCVNHFMEVQGKSDRYGHSEEANQLGVEIMEKLQSEVFGFKSKYANNWGNHFWLHSQVGAEGDEETTPGVRIPIGEEPALYDQIRQAGLFHKYFPTGVGDIFPFDSTAKKNPGAILDIIKGAFNSGMRYMSVYEEDGETIRVTGYLVKKSEIERYKEGTPVVNETTGGAYSSTEYHKALHRKVRKL